MIEGDLAETGLAELLVELAEGGATGCVTLTGPDGGQGAVHLRQGRPYAAHLPGDAGRATDRGADGDGHPVGAALAELVGWQRGTWSFRLEAPAPAVDSPVVKGVDEGADTGVDDGVDTAALLRELAALAADDEPDQPVRLPAPRPAVAPRRRSLFGRG